MSLDLAACRKWHLDRDPNFAPRLEWVEARMNRCDSDLERLFLILFAFQTSQSAIFTFAGEAPPGKALTPGRFSVDVEQQVAIVGYRCDFLLTVRLSADQRTRRVAVECDGHSFHDRTPEQASHDWRRDRKLIAEGVPTLRYTFSDLTKEPVESMLDLRRTMLAIAAELCGPEERP